MPKIKGLRWWIIGLIMLGSCINYLTRSTLAVAAPTILQDLKISEKEYSWIVRRFSGRDHAAADLRLYHGRDRAPAWIRPVRDRMVLVSMAHSLAHSWQAFAFLRGLLGFNEGSANPAGMKATAEWFPAKERGIAGGIYNIGASFGSMIAPPLVVWAILHYNWQASFLITGALGLVWVVFWLLFYQSPGKTPGPDG